MYFKLSETFETCKLIQMDNRSIMQYIKCSPNVHMLIIYQENNSNSEKVDKPLEMLKTQSLTSQKPYNMRTT